ncbi:MAG TPA: ribonuclease HI family protein [Candidatus Coatesbacteria bacterium]|nr:ribonuclease HI family protein [Candidatus Coatesbacteria bacterium]
MEEELRRLKKLRDDLAAGREPEREGAVAALDWALGRLAPKAGRLFADGGVRGNPGPAAYGLVLYDARGNELLRRARKIGRATNNVAEYAAVIAGLELARQLGLAELDVYLDAQLVVRQLTGEYRTKEPRLAELKSRALALAAGLTAVRFHHIPRGENRLADALVSAALDGREPDAV